MIVNVNWHKALSLTLLSNLILHEKSIEEMLHFTGVAAVREDCELNYAGRYVRLLCNRIGEVYKILSAYRCHTNTNCKVLPQKLIMVSIFLVRVLENAYN